MEVKVSIELIYQKPNCKESDIALSASNKHRTLTNSEGNLLGS